MPFVACYVRLHLSNFCRFGSRVSYSMPQTSASLLDEAAGTFVVRWVLRARFGRPVQRANTEFFAKRLYQAFG